MDSESELAGAEVEEEEVEVVELHEEEGDATTVIEQTCPAEAAVHQPGPKGPTLSNRCLQAPSRYVHSRGAIFSSAGGAIGGSTSGEDGSMTPIQMLLSAGSITPQEQLRQKLREQMASSAGIVPPSLSTAADRFFAKVDSRANLVMEPGPLPGHGSGGPHARPPHALPQTTA